MKFENVSTSGCAVADKDTALYKSLLFSRLVRQRNDLELQQIVEEYDTPLDFEPLDGLMISEAAWEFVLDANIEPRLVFGPSGASAGAPRSVTILQGHGFTIPKAGSTVGSVSVQLGGRFSEEAS